MRMTNDERRRVTLYTKPGCHLCDEALALLLSLGDEMDKELSITEVNILEDPTLYTRYRHAIPVIVVDPDAGGPTLHAPITAPVLRRALS
jgi:glutaredoxin